MTGYERHSAPDGGTYPGDIIYDAVERVWKVATAKGWAVFEEGSVQYSQVTAYAAEAKKDARKQAHIKSRIDPPIWERLEEKDAHQHQPKAYASADIHKFLDKQIEKAKRVPKPPNRDRVDAKKWRRMKEVWDLFQGQDVEDIADALFGEMEEIHNETEEKP